ncbi:hypothetical protein [Streptosporangium sandarakinum]|uniref:hypothetical protein n=1 Tax=Streptosporangium sandarakinum TaxID=1260955 RepID=UPI003679CEE9
MARRWRPKGRGFRCIYDEGDTALWLRREGSILTGVLYLDWDADWDSIWTFQCKLNAPILHTIYDKPRRIAWLEGKTSMDNRHGGVLLSREPILAWPRRKAPKSYMRGQRRAKRRMERHLRTPFYGYPQQSQRLRSSHTWLPAKYRR